MMFIEVNLQHGMSCEGALNPSPLESPTHRCAVALENGKTQTIRKVADNFIVLKIFSEFSNTLIFLFPTSGELSADLVVLWSLPSNLLFENSNRLLRRVVQTEGGKT